jgi:hypothetical protein
MSWQPAPGDMPWLEPGDFTPDLGPLGYWDAPPAKECLDMVGWHRASGYIPKGQSRGMTADELAELKKKFA